MDELKNNEEFFDFGDSNDINFSDSDSIDFGDSDSIDFGDSDDVDFGDSDTVDFGDSDDVDFGDSDTVDFGDSDTTDFGDSNDIDFSELDSTDFDDSDTIDFGGSDVEDIEDNSDNSIDFKDNPDESTAFEYNQDNLNFGDLDNIDFTDIEDNAIGQTNGDNSENIAVDTANTNTQSVTSDGVMVDSSELLSDETEEDNDRSFISDIGEVVIQDDADTAEDGFSLVYLNIQQIAITKRIRTLDSAESLVRSIKSTGLVEPVVVAPTATKDVYVLLHGFRRLNACAKAGKTKIPCVVNNRISTPEIPIIEALYNHCKRYSMQETIDYIDYLEKEKGIMNAAMIEYLLQMNSGDYTKLKDILSDNDEDIVTKLLNGQYTIEMAFKKLEQRRKKESAEERENKQAARVYENEEESGANQIEGSGEAADGAALTPEQIKELSINADGLDDDIEDSSLNDMIEEDKKLEGFEPHKQKTGEREFVDPIIRKSVMARDKDTCQCCKRGGQQYVDILDYHHILPVFLGGEDTVDNGIMLCVACHRLVHLYSTDDLHVDKALLSSNFDELKEEAKMRYENEEIFEDEKKRFKRIIKLGSVIRKGIAARGMNREQYKKEHSNKGIGRRMPGVNAPQTQI